jgi:hypothetical protein
VIKLKHILSEQAVSINGLFKSKKQIAKIRQKAWEKWVSLFNKSQDSQMRFRHMEKDLLDQRERVMSDMEDDDDVLQNVNVGHKGAVARYGKELDSIDKKMQIVHEKVKTLDSQLKNAKEDSVKWARKEDIIIKAIKNALKVK